MRRRCEFTGSGFALSVLFSSRSEFGPAVGASMNWAKAWKEAAKLYQPRSLSWTRKAEKRAQKAEKEREEAIKEANEFQAQVLLAAKERDEAWAELLELRQEIEDRAGTEASLLEWNEKLDKELKAAEAACAAFRAELQRLAEWNAAQSNENPCMHGRSRPEHFSSMLHDENPGRGWVSPEEHEKVKAERDAIRKNFADECKWEACGNCASCLRDQWYSPAELDELENGLAALRAENEKLRAELTSHKNVLQELMKEHNETCAELKEAKALLCKWRDCDSLCDTCKDHLGERETFLLRGGA